MADAGGTTGRRWRYGVYPNATGSTIGSMRRVDLPLGEALRVEMADPDQGGDAVHVQYYIITEFGGWALWTSAARGELADLDAMVPHLTP